jgi:CheY-like chemotaxis protein
MRRILLVDDHLSTCTPLTKLLRSRGYEAMFALSGREGILAMERFTPDVVLLDVMMPRMDGFETLGLIRGRPEFAQVAVLMYTAMCDPAAGDGPRGAGPDRQGQPAGRDMHRGPTLPRLPTGSVTSVEPYEQA